MQHVGITAAVAIVLLAASSGASAESTPAPMVMTMAPMPTASLVPKPQPPMAFALDARSLRGARTAGGYRLSGQALVKDACTAARFTPFLGTIFPPQFDVVQYRRPGTMGMMCMQRLTWVTAVPLLVTSAAPPRYVTVRTQKGTTRVPLR